MVDFARNVRQFVERAKTRMTLVFRGIGMEAVIRVKELTPVDTGFLRANWIDAESGDVSLTAQVNPVTGRWIARVMLGETIYVLNPVPYARRMEYGFVGQDSLGREYDQGGYHMVQQTLAELPEMAARVIEELAA